MPTLGRSEDLHGDGRERESCGRCRHDDSMIDLHARASLGRVAPAGIRPRQRGSPKVAQFDGAPPCARAAAPALSRRKPPSSASRGRHGVGIRRVGDFEKPSLQAKCRVKRYDPSASGSSAIPLPLRALLVEAVGGEPAHGFRRRRVFDLTAGPLGPARAESRASATISAASPRPRDEANRCVAVAPLGERLGSQDPTRRSSTSPACSRAERVLSRASSRVPRRSEPFLDSRRATGRGYRSAEPPRRSPRLGEARAPSERRLPGRAHARPAGPTARRCRRARGATGRRRARPDLPPRPRSK